VTARESTPCDPDCTIREWPHDGSCESQRYLDGPAFEHTCRSYDECGARCKAQQVREQTAAEVVEQTLYDLGYTGSLSSDAHTVLDRLIAAGHMPGPSS
jgi:hypothetical protein